MSTWFSYNKGVTASGLRARLEPQAYYYWRGLGLMAEYAQDEHSLNLFTTKPAQNIDQPYRHLHRHRLFRAGLLHTDG